jgi:dimethylglycine catabolism A
MVSHARLFDPIPLRGAVIPNRIVMPPMTTRLAATDGSVTAELIQYYVARAAGGTGLVTIEMASPHPAGRHRAGELGLMGDRFLPGLRTLTGAVIGDCRVPGRTLDAIAHAAEVANQL